MVVSPLVVLALAKEKEGDSVPTKLALPLLFVLQDESGRYVMTNTSVSDPNQDLYYSYEYDTYGNIRSAEAHGSYHISDDYTNDYEYNNPKWLDLLTGFNDELIIYEGQSIVNGETGRYHPGGQCQWRYCGRVCL